MIGAGSRLRIRIYGPGKLTGSVEQAETAAIAVHH